MSRTASHCEFRNKQGGLINWVELRKVKGREKVWNNCLGFSRVNPSGGGTAMRFTPRPGRTVKYICKSDLARKPAEDNYTY